MRLLPTSPSSRDLSSSLFHACLFPFSTFPPFHLSVSVFVLRIVAIYACLCRVFLHCRFRNNAALSVAQETDPDAHFLLTSQQFFSSIPKGGLPSQWVRNLTFTTNETSDIPGYDTHAAHVLPSSTPCFACLYLVARTWTSACDTYTRVCDV